QFTRAACNSLTKTSPAASRPRHPARSTIKFCFLRSIATFAAHPPAFVLRALTAANSPGRGSARSGPQKAAFTRRPAQPILPMAVCLSATTEPPDAFQNCIADRTPSGDHDVPITADTQQLMRIVYARRDARRHVRQVSLLKVSTKIHFCYSH